MIMKSEMKKKLNSVNFASGKEIVLATVLVVRTDDGAYLSIRDKNGEVCSQRLEKNRKYEVSITGNEKHNKIKADIWL